MFHVKIEIEQHKSGISLQYKSKDNTKQPDILFLSDNEKSQFLELFPRKNKIIRTPPIFQPKVLLFNFTFYENSIILIFYIFRKQ